MDSLGLRVISKLLEEKSFEQFINKGLTREHFFKEIHVVDKFIHDYILQYSEWPTKKAVEENCKIDLPEVTEPLEYVLELLRKRSLAFEIEKDLKDSIEKLESREPDEALSILKTLVFKAITVANNTVAVTDYEKRYQKRLDDYEAGKAVAKTIPTGWSKLDELIQGWLLGGLHSIIARSNTGKSWFLCIIAEYMRTLGKKVLFVTMEMEESRLEERLDVLQFKLPWRKYKRNELEDFDKERWKKKIQDKDENESLIKIAGKKTVKSVDDVNALFFQYKPDIVLIDGGYRLKSRENKERGWASDRDIIDDLQVSAEYSNVPWLATTQFNEESTKKINKNTRPTRSDVRYAKEWVINPDVVLYLYANEDYLSLKQLEVGLMKNRDATDDFEPFLIHWDFNELNFAEIVLDEDDDTTSPNTTSKDEEEEISF